MEERMGVIKEGEVEGVSERKGGRIGEGVAERTQAEDRGEEANGGRGVCRRGK